MPSFRPVEVLVHPAVGLVYDHLEADAKSGRQPGAAIWKSLQVAFQRARSSAQFADPIPPRKIPAHFRQAYGVQNLYCVDLASFWRGFYTIEARCVIFLDVVDHAAYDQWFPNKGK